MNPPENPAMRDSPWVERPGLSRYPPHTPSTRSGPQGDSANAVKVLDNPAGGSSSTIAVFNMYVTLPHNFSKHRHMSRFVKSSTPRTRDFRRELSRHAADMVCDFGSEVRDQGTSK